MQILNDIYGQKKQNFLFYGCQLQLKNYLFKIILYLF